ncbi:MAG: PadR family transcriptional regulator [Cellvibrionaceae bacterium]
MSLKHAILSMVISGPKTGYAIAKEFDGSVNYYWQASHQQIYKTLADLEAQKWLCCTKVKQVSKPDKKEYGITQIGEKELQCWVELPIKAQPVKNALLIKLLSIELVGVLPLIKQLEETKVAMSQKLSVFQNIKQQYYSCDPAKIDSLYLTAKYLTLTKGISWVCSELEWLDDSIGLLKKKLVI